MMNETGSVSPTNTTDFEKVKQHLLSSMERLSKDVTSFEAEDAAAMADLARQYTVMEKWQHALMFGYPQQ